jgi:hypothetical protein
MQVFSNSEVENEYCCIISEYCAKGNLQKIFEKKDPLSEAVSYFECILYICL